MIKLPQHVLLPAFTAPLAVRVHAYRGARRCSVAQLQLRVCLTSIVFRFIYVCGCVCVCVCVVGAVTQLRDAVLKRVKALTAAKSAYTVDFSACVERTPLGTLPAESLDGMIECLVPLAQRQDCM